jgi:hypothetical protein
VFEGLRLIGSRARIIAAAAMLGVVQNAACASSITEATAALMASDRPGRPFFERSKAAEQIYATRIDPKLDHLETMQTHELTAAFDATDRVALYALVANPERMPHYVGRMTALLDALASRQALKQPHAGATFDTLVAVRRFDEAAALAQRHPQLLGDRVVPTVVMQAGFDASMPAVLALQADGSLLARNVDRNGPHLVNVIGCRASQRALDEINALPGLAEALDAVPVFWLLPAERMTDPGFLREWNARYPKQPAMFAYANAPWHGVEFHAMPHFQRFEGERRVANLLGWKRSGGERQLLDMLDRQSAHQARNLSNPNNRFSRCARRSTSARNSPAPSIE